MSQSGQEPKQGFDAKPTRVGSRSQRKSTVIIIATACSLLGICWPDYTVLHSIDSRCCTNLKFSKLRCSHVSIWGRRARGLSLIALLK
jgi:hypothetical protein